MPEELAISQIEVAARLLAAVFLCGAVGFEREIRDQPAGFRTHILLGLGAALFTLVSAYGFPEFTSAASEGNIQFDPTRIAAQIVTGVGFLGAGAIIREGRGVRGLTTAASLWTVAAIGVAAGAGYLFGAAAATAITLATLYALRKFRSAVDSRLRVEQSTLTLTMSSPEHSPSRALQTLQSHGMSVRDLDVEVEGGQARYRASVKVSPPYEVHEAIAEISALPGVEELTVTGLHGPEMRGTESGSSGNEEEPER